MTCEDIRNQALLAACGEADGAAVRDPAARCPACAAEIRALQEGLELLKHLPRETPSRATTEAIGAMLLREAPRRASRPVAAWAAAAAVLMAVSAAALAWKLGAWAPSKAPVVVKQDTRREAPAPKPVPPAVAKKQSADLWLPKTETVDARVGDMSDAVTELGGGAPAPKTFDRTAVWFRLDSNAVDSMYQGLEEIATSPDKF